MNMIENQIRDTRQELLERREQSKRYQAGREQWTQERLDPYMGNWAAFSADGTQILASAEDLGDVFRILDEKGIDPQDTPLEHLIYAEGCDTGGADLEYVEIPIPPDSDSGVDPSIPAATGIASVSAIGSRDHT